MLKPGASLREDQASFLGLPQGDALILDAGDTPLSDFVFLSVPPDMPAEALLRMRDRLQELFSQTVIVVTHNLAFLRAEQVTEHEAKRILHVELEKQSARAAKEIQRGIDRSLVGD